MSKLLKLLTFISPKFLDLLSDFILIESYNRDFLLETLKKGFFPIFSATPTINKSHKELAI